MIIFDLACNAGHRFEGWFRSADDFTQQLERSLVTCPHCASADVRRLPSVINLAKTGASVEAAAEARSAAQPAAKAAPATASGHTPAAAKPLPDPTAVAARLQEMLHTALAQCEDVGNQFADEARRIHYAEAPERPIRGQATRDEYEALRDEGIDVLALPRLKTTLN